MSRDLIDAICAAMPGAKVPDPWGGGGRDAWKLGGKMLACVGAVTPGVSVRTDSVETAEMLIDAGIAVKAPYFHRSWAKLPFESQNAGLRHRIESSYSLVRAVLPMKVRAALPPGQ